jgi:hypothetical protein
MCGEVRLGGSDLSGFFRTKLIELEKEQQRLRDEIAG